MCSCQDSNQQSSKVLFNMSPSSLYNTLSLHLKLSIPLYVQKAEKVLRLKLNLNLLDL